MNFPLYIAKRYLFAKSGNNAINIITIIASIGVILGTAALFIILSGFSGLRTFNYALLDSSDPDIKITATKGKSFFYENAIKNVVLSSTDIVAFSNVIEERVFIKNGEITPVHFHKNHKANLMNLCEDCHHKIHEDDIEYKRVKTSEGYRIKPI